MLTIGKFVNGVSFDFLSFVTSYRSRRPARDADRKSCEGRWTSFCGQKKKKISYRSMFVGSTVHLEYAKQPTSGRWQTINRRSAFRLWCTFIAQPGANLTDSISVTLSLWTTVQSSALIPRALFTSFPDFIIYTHTQTHAYKAFRFVPSHCSSRFAEQLFFFFFFCSPSARSIQHYSFSLRVSRGLPHVSEAREPFFLIWPPFRFILGYSTFPLSLKNIRWRIIIQQGWEN